MDDQSTHRERTAGGGGADLVTSPSSDVPGDVLSSRTLRMLLADLPAAPLRARALVQRGSDRPQESVIGMDVGRQWWRVERDDGTVFEHRDGQRSTPEGDLGRMGFLSNLPDLGLKLLLAEPLPMWGRRRDDYRVDTTEQVGDDLIITFVHRRDPVVRAAARLDGRTRRLLRLVRPTDVTEIVLG